MKTLSLTLILSFLTFANAGELSRSKQRLERLGQVVAFEKVFSLSVHDCMQTWDFERDGKGKYGGCRVRFSQSLIKDEFMWQGKAELGAKELAPGIQIYWEVYPTGYSLQLSSEEEITSSLAFHYLKDFIDEQKELSVRVLKIQTN